MSNHISISEALVIDLSWKEGRLKAVSENDHILRRFGQIDLVQLTDGEAIAVHRKRGADEVWVLVQGLAELVLVDRREESPSFQTSKQINLQGVDPQAVLIPFGVAAELRPRSNGLLLRVSSHAETEFEEDLVFGSTDQVSLL